MKRNEAVSKKLKELGFSYNQKAHNIIRECNDWYTNNEGTFHTRHNINGVDKVIDSINFAKRGCEDDANLCEVVEVNSGEASFDTINEILKTNRFDVMYRKQLEQMCATGTVGCYVWIEDADIMEDGTATGGKIRLNYCDAEDIIPLTIVNDEVLECAFVGENIVKGTDETVLVVFTLEDGKYIARTYYFKDDKEEPEKATEVQLDVIKPFCVMRTAQVNNLKNMEGYGLPKLYSAIPVLKGLDLAYAILMGDLDKGDKLVFINELLSCVATDMQTGEKFLTKQQKELFVLLGEKLPEQNSVISEYNPEIRIDAITKTFETLLSLFSLMFGYGTKKYTFENGKLTTATEYIGTRQDAMQELNKQRKSAVDYITDIVKAIMWFSNTFLKTSFNIDNLEVNVEFDDSYVTDREAEIERVRNDALTFDIPQLVIWYLMKAYNLDENEAKALVEAKAQKDAEADEDDDLGEEE